MPRTDPRASIRQNVEWEVLVLYTPLYLPTQNHNCNICRLCRVQELGPTLTTWKPSNQSSLPTSRAAVKRGVGGVVDWRVYGVQSMEGYGVVAFSPR